MNFLEERNSKYKIITIVIQTMISEKKYKEVLGYFETNFSSYKKNNKEMNYKQIVVCIICLIYFDCLKRSDHGEAYEILQSLDVSYWNKNLKVSLYDQDKKIIDLSLEV